MFFNNKFYSIENHSNKRLGIPITIKEDYTIFHILASTSGLSPVHSRNPRHYVGLSKYDQDQYHIQEIPQKDLPLWIGSKYTSQEFETLLKGISK